MNSEARDYSPRLMPGGRTLVFTSDRHFAVDGRGRPLAYASLTAGLAGTANGNSNLYVVDLPALGVLPGGPATRWSVAERAAAGGQS